MTQLEATGVEVLVLLHLQLVLLQVQLQVAATCRGRPLAAHLLLLLELLEELPDRMVLRDGELHLVLGALTLLLLLLYLTDFPENDLEQETKTKERSDDLFKAH